MRNASTKPDRKRLRSHSWSDAKTGSINPSYFRSRLDNTALERSMVTQKYPFQLADPLHFDPQGHPRLMCKFELLSKINLDSGEILGVNHTLTQLKIPDEADKTPSIQATLDLIMTQDHTADPGVGITQTLHIHKASLQIKKRSKD